MARTRREGRKRTSGLNRGTTGERAGLHTGPAASSRWGAGPIRSPIRSFVDRGGSAAALKARLYLAGGVILAFYGALAGALGWLVGLSPWWPSALAIVAIYAYGSGQVRGRRGER